MWVLYLWITQWRHGPLILPPHTSHQTHNNVPIKKTKKKQPSHQNLCHPLPHHITSRTLQATVVRWAGNKPLGSQRTRQSNVLKSFRGDTVICIFTVELCQLKMSALNMQLHICFRNDGLCSCSFPIPLFRDLSVAFLSTCSILHTSYQTFLFVILSSLHFQHLFSHCCLYTTFLKIISSNWHFDGCLPCYSKLSI